jgi:hypothetical protein
MHIDSPFHNRFFLVHYSSSTLLDCHRTNRYDREQVQGTDISDITPSTQPLQQPQKKKKKKSPQKSAFT